MGTVLHPTAGEVDVMALAEEARKLVGRVAAEGEQIQAANPSLKVSDARLTCFSKFQNVLGSFWLGCGFWGLHLLSPDWWVRHTDIPEPARRTYRMEYQGFLKLGLVQLSFSTIESSLRLFMRAIDPAAHAGATLEFKRVYDDLLLRRLSAPQPGFVELIDMAAKIRNTVHNNGVYFHKSGKSADQQFKGRSYRFEHGRPIEFTGWALTMDVTADLIGLLSVVVHDPAIAGIAADIPDPMA